MSATPLHGRRRAEPIRTDAPTAHAKSVHAAHSFESGHAAHSVHAALPNHSAESPRRADSVRRPESVRRPDSGRRADSGRRKAHKPSPASGPLKRMAGVTITAALLATAGGFAAHAASNSSPGLQNADVKSEAADALALPSAISAPADIRLDLQQIKIGSIKANPSKSPSLKGEAASISTDAPASKSSAPPVAVDDPAAARSFAASLLGTHGWGADQMQCLSLLWERESSWLTSAENASSGAYGIAQSLPAEKMAATGADYRTNYKTQITWGLSYISARYGSPCGAWGHSESVGWY